MSNEEINRYIHSQIMERCIVPDYVNCDCTPADYCSDDSPRALLNDALGIVLENCGRDAYDDAMEAILKPIVLSQMPRKAKSEREARSLANEMAERIVVMSINPTAEQIARACVEAHASASAGDKGVEEAT